MRFTITIEASSSRTSSGTIAFDTKLVSDTWVARVASSNTRLSFVWTKSNRCTQIYISTNALYLPCGFEISYLSRKSRSELYGTHRSIYIKKKTDVPQALVVSRGCFNAIWTVSESKHRRSIPGTSFGDERSPRTVIFTSYTYVAITNTCRDYCRW